MDARNISVQINKCIHIGPHQSKIKDFFQLLPGEAFAPCGRCHPKGATISNFQQSNKLKFAQLNMQKQPPKSVAVFYEKITYSRR